MQNPIAQVRLSAAEAAARIRKDMKAAFPGTKFSVRSARFSMGSSVDVSYEDGPSRDAVEAVATRYGQRGFQSSDDSTYYVGSEVAVLTADGIVAPTYGGWVAVSRKVSPVNVEAVTVSLGRAPYVSDLDAVDLRDGFFAAWRSAGMLA